MTRLLSLLLFCLLALVAQAQYQYQQLNYRNGIRLNAHLYGLNQSAHTSVLPLKKWSVDSPQTEIQLISKRSWLHRKIFSEHLISLKGKDYYITIDPVVNFQLGTDGDEELKYVNTRGFQMEGRLGEKVSFTTSYLENQGFFPSYVSDFVQTHYVVPGQGHARDYKEDGFDYGIASGEVTYSPDDMFSFSLGQGRNFFGEGYRSMFLSDAAFNYPFFRIQTTFGKVKYTNLWAQLYDVRPSINRGNTFSKKYLSSHYLSINLTDRLNISFFEAIVSGDTAQQKSVDIAFFNPIIFYRPVEYAVGSASGNALMGMAASYKIFDRSMVYGQFILDEFNLESLSSGEGSWVNKFGGQLGIKFYDFLGKEGLFSRLEYNSARPYTFSHREVLTNYGHYGQPLGHPWGANFHEGVFQLAYFQPRWEAELRTHYGVMGLDENGSNWGMDIYKSYNSREQDLGNSTAQGKTAIYAYLMLRAAYVVNPTSGLKLEAGARIRNLNVQSSTQPFSGGQSTYMFIGLRTEFFNSYYDF